jgi:hypothetical protein
MKPAVGPGPDGFTMTLSCSNQLDRHPRFKSTRRIGQNIGQQIEKMKKDVYSFGKIRYKNTSKNIGQKS